MTAECCYSPPHKRPNLNEAAESALSWFSESWKSKFADCEKSIEVSKEVILQLRSFFRSASQDEGIRCLSNSICSYYGFKVCVFKYDEHLKITSIVFEK